uniref:Solute carrier family 12 member 3-like n=1 Tax=Echeneis naucrates TaxID=173247 RepID=A0A665WQN3_ECHNA
FSKHFLLSNSVSESRRSSIYSTLDLVPQLENYTSTLPHQRSRGRPSLEALRKTFDVITFTVQQEKEPSPQQKAPVRFGWVTGVMIRCMLNIWGVILFLRLSWIVSQAGILLTCLIILMSVTVTSVTALSISAIATNGRVTSGGAYFMISRSLGPEMGGPIGMVFSFANALACALNTIGFAEVVTDLMKEFGVVMVDSVNDLRIVGVITVTVLLVISLAGMEWESKVSTYLHCRLVFMIVEADESPHILLFALYQTFSCASLFFRPSIFSLQFFWSLFPTILWEHLFLLVKRNRPLVSLDTEDPAVAIPKGTLMAILWTTISYLGIAITVGSCVLRDASGNMTDILMGNITDGCVGLGCKLGWNFTECIESHSCKYGLANNSSNQVLGQVSGLSYLITAGVFAASLSSALGFLVSAPKVFQCLCRDKIYPYIEFFAKGYGKNDEPLRAYLLCYLIAVAFILIGDLNIIAPLISNFFLCSYALINFSCFHASITNSPGWRPLFHYYSKWTALFGAVVSVVLMFLLTWWAAVITFTILLFLFGYINYNKPKVNWGSSVQAGTYNLALSYSASLSGVEDHVKNFRPQCLVLTGPPNQRPALVDFVGSFTKHISLMICGDIITVSSSVSGTFMSLWLNKRKVRSFYTPFSAVSLRAGAQHLLQATGLGKLKPNTLVLGFKTNWRESSPEGIDDYINTIYDTFDSNNGLCILRMMDGLDIFDQFDVDNVPVKDNTQQAKTVFQNDQGKKTIDVYWIADDGGLTLLVPYLLTRRKRWHSSKVRVFIVGDEQNMEEGRAEMVALLKRFRLDFNDVIIMTDSEKYPQARKFADSVDPFRLHDEQQEGVSVEELRQTAPWKISDKEFEVFKPKSARIVRLNEIIRRNSQHAALVLVSLPVPHTDCPRVLFMAWMDTLTCGLHCPTVLIRGNQQSVLTFYCQ